MNLSEIKTSLEKIKRDLDEAFEKGQIDFDGIDSSIMSIINGIEKLRKSAKHSPTAMIIDCDLYR